MPLAGGVLIALLLFALLETAVRMLGFTPGVRDGADLWGLMRAQANDEHAIVLAGGSRIQLDIDTKRLAQLSGQPVVQLAIDGQSFQPVLRDLAGDPDFHGTLLIDAMDQNLTVGIDETRAQGWINYWHQHLRTEMSARSDAWLALLLQQTSAWYAAEAPWQVMLQYIASGAAGTHYLVSAPDRSRRADYGSPEMQANFYARRILRNFAKPVDTSGVQTIGDLEALVGALLDQEVPANLPGFDENSKNIAEWTRQIETRGGRVIFLRLPSWGLVRRIEDVRYPRSMYWDRLVATADVDALHFTDEATLATYQPPDGSHLDQRDIGRFTGDLYLALVARGLLPDTAAASTASPTH